MTTKTESKYPPPGVPVQLADKRLYATADSFIALYEACQRALCDLELAHGGRETLTTRQLKAALSLAEGKVKP